MKPVNKSEAGWKYFRDENRHAKSRKSGISKYGKRQMSKAVRRFGKREILASEKS